MLLTPFPRHLETPGPDPQPFGTSRTFVRLIPTVAISGPIDRPPPADDRGIDLPTFRPTNGNDPLVAIPTATFALHSPFSCKLAHHGGAISTTLIDLTVLALTGLVILRCVDSPEPDADAVHIEGVPVYYPDGSRNICCHRRENYQQEDAEG
jgi:hypothetical protein